MTSKEIINILDNYIKNPVCELKYTKDYELLISVLLSSQSTDKRVNSVTSILFNKYDSLSKLNDASIKDIEKIIYPVGTYKKKASYIKGLVNILINDYNGIVPKDIELLEKLPGVGRKTASVFLLEFYNIPTMPVDTHVFRVSKRLKITNLEDDILKTEEKLKKFFPKNLWSRVHLQLVLFGRYTCKSRNPKCEKCPFNKKCNYKLEGRQ